MNHTIECYRPVAATSVLPYTVYFVELGIFFRREGNMSGVDRNDPGSYYTRFTRLTRAGVNLVNNTYRYTQMIPPDDCEKVAYFVEKIPNLSKGEIRRLFIGAGFIAE
jgi:hypothetical protein